MNYQPKNAIDNLLDEKINQFKYSFIDNSRSLFVNEEGKLIHPGEFGTYREAVVKAFLSSLVPERMGIESGFVVTSAGKISTQCDIVIFDRTVTPLIKNESGQRFFPIESVVAIGEVKSKISLKNLKNALRKLAKTKFFRDDLLDASYIYCRKETGLNSEYQPAIHELDQIITFLVCEEFEFDTSEDNIRNITGCYNQEHPKRPSNLRHNLVLSIKDGLLTYFYEWGNCIYPFPFKSLNGQHNRLPHRFLFSNNESSEHIRHFASSLNIALTSVSVLYPEMANYISGNEDVLSLDLEQEM